MRACVNCMRSERFNGVTRYCKLHKDWRENDNTCDSWEQEDLHQRTLEEIDREEHHDF